MMKGALKGRFYEIMLGIMAVIHKSRLPRVRQDNQTVP
jgi:hypothetical protein